MKIITFSDIIITVYVILEVIQIRDNIKGGALTETTFLILLAVYEPNHGYGIMQFIEKITKGRVSLGAGTLYGALNTILKKQWISPVINTTNTNKKEYLITDLGRHVVQDELQRIRELLEIGSTTIGGGPK